MSKHSKSKDDRKVKNTIRKDDERKAERYERKYEAK
jgi:hypothetical protein